MTCNDIIHENNEISEKFVDAGDNCDISALETLFRMDFIWGTAAISEDHSNESRPMQARELHGKDLPHWSAPA